MADVTTSVTKTELERVTAEHAGFAVFDAADTLVARADRSNQDNYRIDESLKSAVSLITDCGYDFSFFRPIALITLASGASTVELPADFNWLVGDVIPYSSTQSRSRVLVRPVGDVYMMESACPTQTGPPEYAGVDAVRGTSPNQSNRYQLKVFPAADQAYDLRIQYSLVQGAMSESFPYAYGCGQHPELLKQACRAAYEIRYDKPNTTEWMMFQQLLNSAIVTDKRRKASNAGTNVDRSDWDEQAYGDQRAYNRSWGGITINGVTVT